MASNNGNLDFPGQGRKRPQRNLSVDRLFLDNENPRLPEDARGKNEDELIRILYSQFFIDELAESMSRNGYFDEEPMVAVPVDTPDDLQRYNSEDIDERARFEEFIDSENTVFTVVEGNRRLATVKLLLNANLKQQVKVSRSFPEITEPIANDLQLLPVIVYSNRKDVIPYLGVRHIVGIEKWDPFAKARYIAKNIEQTTADGVTVRDAIKEIQAQIGDSQQGVLKSYTSFRLLKQAQESFDYDMKLATANKFSLLTLAIGQAPLREYLGLPQLAKIEDFESPVTNDKVNNLEDLLTWLFGDGRRLPVIKESRDITRYLKEVVRNDAAVVHLKQSYDLLEAYDRTDGEEKMVLKYIVTANRNLETVLGMAHRHKTEDVIDQAERCSETASRLLETVTEQ